MKDSTVWDFKMGPLAILTGDCINRFFLCMAILLGRKNVTVILRCQYYQGGRKAAVPL